MTKIILELDAEFFEKNKTKAKKAFDDNLDKNSDLQGKGYRFVLDLEKQEMDADNGTFTVSLMDEHLNYIDLKYVLENEDLIKLAELLIKRLNKAKSYHELMESA